MQQSPASKAGVLSIFLLARSLEVGGTERQIVALARGLRKRGHKVTVGLFYGVGALVSELPREGIEVVDLRKAGRWDMLPFVTRTIQAIRRSRPDIVYSFLGGANVVAAAIKRFIPHTKLVWSVRNSSRDLSIANALARLSFTLEAVLASSPDAIIANSAAGRAFAIGRGFPANRIWVVGNGIDTSRFRADPKLRTEQRRKLGLKSKDVAIGVLGRLNSAKDYPTFLHAARIVVPSAPQARFLCVGAGPELEHLQDLAARLEISDRVIFTGELDATAALNAFDIACSPSLTEGFSNAIAEAMSCGLPCIVTDAGDSSAIVGDAGTVVPIRSPDALASAMIDGIERLSVHDANACRSRIVDNFSIEQMVEGTLGVFQDLSSRKRMAR